MSVAPYITAPDDIAPAVWLPLGSAWVSLPMLDAATGLYARMGYAWWVAYAATIGARLPTHDEINALRAVAVDATVILPSREDCAAAGVPYVECQAKEDFRTRNMRGREWCERADQRAAAKLAAAGWTGGVPVLMGKPWIKGPPGSAHEYPPGGTAWLMGYTNGAGWWQSGTDSLTGKPGFHEAGVAGDPKRPGYTDIAATQVLMCDHDPSAEVQF